MSLSSILPKPKNIPLTKSRWDSSDEDENDDHNISFNSSSKSSQSKSSKKLNSSDLSASSSIPPYGKRSKGFIPKSVKDFGDGGAFPEIKIVQYPLDMGRPGQLSTNKNVLSLQTDTKGNIRYDMVVHQNKREGAMVQSTLNHLKPIDVSEKDGSLIRPDDHSITETTEKTRDALEKIIENRINAVQGRQQAPPGTSGQKEAEFIKYTPQSSNGNGEAQTRIIRMSHAQVDPFEPPKFRHKRTGRPPGSPPAPVLRSPPRKVTAEEQKEWVIPPCISNWKNTKGYTIPLDKRLAADGRGLQDAQINDNFAKLAEALYVADRHVREEVKIRATMQAKLATKEKKEKEEKLRMLAQKAREERAGMVTKNAHESEDHLEGYYQDKKRVVAAAESRSPVSPDSSSDASDREDEPKMSKEDLERMKEREAIRKEKQKQREREMRLTHMGSETKAKVLSKLGDRDISEKIALGIAQPTISKETMYDSRLFNQSSGLGAGFGNEDTYNVYDKPLFAGSSASQIYRPKRMEQQEEYGGITGVNTDGIEKLLGEGAPHRGFKGADDQDGGNAARDGPVQFEKEEAEDPFGLEQFLSSAKRGRDKIDEALKNRGTMHASSAGKRDDYEVNQSSGRRQMEFESSSANKKSRNQ